MSHALTQTWRLRVWLTRIGRYALRVVRAFSGNGGYELAGAVAYNGLLSIIPLFLLASTTFARFVDHERFVAVVMRQLQQIMPGRNARPITEALRAQLEVPYAGGIMGFITLVFFSTLAFRTLQHALDVIFSHRRDIHPPRGLLSSIMVSLVYVVALGLLSVLQALGSIRLETLPVISQFMPYPVLAGLAGVLGMTLLLTSIYYVMPFGKGRLRPSLVVGGVCALLWFGVQRALVWYLINVSSVNLIYGSLSAVIVALFSFELVAILVLLGAQLLAELEQNWRAGLRWDEPVPPKADPAARASAPGS